MEQNILKKVEQNILKKVEQNILKKSGAKRFYLDEVKSGAKRFYLDRGEKWIKRFYPWSLPFNPKKGQSPVFFQLRE